MVMSFVRVGEGSFVAKQEVQEIIVVLRSLQSCGFRKAELPRQRKRKG